MAQAQGVNVASLYANGLVDHIVDERHDASLEPREFCERMAQAIEYELAIRCRGAGVPAGGVAGRKVPEPRR